MRMMVVTMISLLLTIVQVSLLVHGRKIINFDVDQKNRRAASTSSAYKFCDSPVTKGKVTFPQSIAGRASVVDKMEMYSGYVKISNAPDYLFYWFFSSQDQNASAPLVIWTNGGPGCSSMEGATTENGPLNLFDIKESCSTPGNCDYSGQLSSNPFSWNVHANVLYLDQPKNVGYSFGYGAETKSSTEAADDFITFYQNWLLLFPEFVGRQLIIAGESYGGHYIPAWANAILNFNTKQVATSAPAINFSGVLIGNGCVNNTVQNSDTFVAFQHENNLIPASSNPKSATAGRAAMAAYLGYQPNYYDYRLTSISCAACYSYNYTAWSYWLLQSDILTALNVCGQAGEDAFAGTAGGCISMGNFDSRDTFDYSGALARTLEAGVPVTLYYGKTDTACDYVGGMTMASTIEWAGKDGFNKEPMRPLELGGVEAGQVKSFGGLTFLQVENAGHMVPLDQPAASAAAFLTILKQL